MTENELAEIVVDTSLRIHRLGLDFSRVYMNQYWRSNLASVESQSNGKFLSQ